MQYHLAEASAFLEDPVLARTNSARLAEARSRERCRESVARIAVDAVLYAFCKPGSIGRIVGEAVQMTIRLERDEARTQEQARSAMRRFVEDLDQVLMRMELEALVARYVERVPPISHVLWRCRASGGERVGPVMVALDPDGYGLFVKLGVDYGWHQGPRDEVLATVPDHLMGSAIAAVVGETLISSSQGFVPA